MTSNSGRAVGRGLHHPDEPGGRAAGGGPEPGAGGAGAPLAEDGAAGGAACVRLERRPRARARVGVKARPRSCATRHPEDLARGHVLVRLLAYYMEWHLRKLAPVLFEKQDRGAARKWRCSPVRQARVSASTNCGITLPVRNPYRRDLS